MAGKKSKSSGKISNGGRQKNNLVHEAKRQELFAKRREEGKTYQYKPNPYKPGTQEYEHEALIRKEKAINSRRIDYAWKAHVFAQLDNYLSKQKEIAKAKN